MSDKNEYFIRAMFDGYELDSERSNIQSAMDAFKSFAIGTDIKCVQIWQMNASGNNGRCIAEYNKNGVQANRVHWNFEPGW